MTGAITAAFIISFVLFNAPHSRAPPQSLVYSSSDIALTLMPLNPVIGITASPRTRSPTSHPASPHQAACHSALPSRPPPRSTVHPPQGLWGTSPHFLAPTPRCIHLSHRRRPSRLRSAVNLDPLSSRKALLTSPSRNCLQPTRRKIIPPATLRDWGDLSPESDLSTSVLEVLIK